MTAPDAPGARRELPPLLAALLDQLPPAGAAFGPAARRRWLVAAAAALDLTWPPDGSEPPVLAADPGEGPPGRLMWLVRNLLVAALGEERVRDGVMARAIGYGRAGYPPASPGEYVAALAFLFRHDPRLGPGLHAAAGTDAGIGAGIGAGTEAGTEAGMSAGTGAGAGAGAEG
jgi:hypothetical protein